jgi:hypothetical protein
VTFLGFSSGAVGGWASVDDINFATEIGPGRYDAILFGSA